MRDKQVRYVLGARIPASAFSAVLRQQNAPVDGVVAVIDARMTIVARTRAEEKFVGGNPSPDFTKAITSADEGAVRSTLLEGIPSFSAWSRSPLTGWIIAIGLPASAVNQPTLQSLQLLVTVGMLTAGAGTADGSSRSLAHRPRPGGGRQSGAGAGAR